jgi:hypothetical protein
MATEIRLEVDLSGFKKMTTNLEKVQGEVLLPVLFNEGFMARHTMFPDLQAMLDASPLVGTSIEGLGEVFQQSNWSEFVNTSSRFPD